MNIEILFGVIVIIGLFLIYVFKSFLDARFSTWVSRSQVVSKRSQDKRIYDDEGAIIGISTNYYITFEDVDTRRMNELQADKYMYESVEKGDVGELNFRGSRLINFNIKRS